MKLQKKTLELFYFEVFRAAFSEAPQGIACVQERPDFVIKSQMGTVGVELTRYFRPSPDRRPLQEQFSLQHRIAELAQRSFEESISEMLNVKVVFKPDFAIDKSDVRSTATRLASAVKSVEVTSTLTRHELGTSDRSSNAVASVYLRSCLPGEPSLWRPATAAWVRRLEPREVQQEIIKKARNLEGYDPDLREVWLLIVAESLAFVELSELAKEFVYESPFAQVLFLEAFTRRCIRLKVRRVDLSTDSSRTVA
jgi:hypothetical protein